MVALVASSSTIALSTSVELAAQERHQQREAGAEARGLDRREQADIHATDGHDDDEEDGDRLLQGAMRSAIAARGPGGRRSPAPVTIWMVMRNRTVRMMPGMTPARNSRPIACSVRSP